LVKEVKITFSKPFLGTIIVLVIPSENRGFLLRLLIRCLILRLILLRVTAFPNFLFTFIPKNIVFGELEGIWEKFLATTARKDLLWNLLPYLLTKSNFSWFLREDINNVLS